MYQHTLSDLESKGVISDELVTIEIGTSLWQQVSSLSKSAATHLLDSATKAIVTVSHNIFCSSQPIMELNSAILLNTSTFFYLMFL